MGRFGGFACAFALSITAAFLATGSLVARAACLDPPVDVTGNGVSNVSDLQCVLVAVTWDAGGQMGPTPGCLGVSVAGADIDCDGDLNVADVVSAINVVLGIPLSLTVDVNQNNCVDQCELDINTDGDPSPDVFDCEPTNPNVYPGNAELCNEVDDNCDDVVDEGFEAKGALCDGPDSDQCENGTLECAGDGLSLVCSAESQVDIAEVCNGLDDDCDSETDEAADSSVGASCDDSNPCTADTCSAGVCVQTPELGACDDGDACTEDDQCAAGVCGGSAVLCDDSDACTLNSCEPSSGCIFTPNIDCEDNNACTTDACDPASGMCVYTDVEGACDDGDPCTLDDQCQQGQCAAYGLVDFACLSEPNGYCAFFGSTGDVVRCPLRLAHEEGASFFASGLQMNALYDTTEIAFLRAVDTDTCLTPVICGEFEVPPAVLSSGHTFAAGPSDLTTWAGAASFLIAHFSTPAIILTDAELDSGEPTGVAGDPELLQFEVELLTDIAPESPAVVAADFIQVSRVVAGTQDIVLMDTALQDGLLTAAEADCTADPTVCDDANPCTDDACTSGSCTYAFNALPCDDGDPGTSGETCQLGVCTP